ncbi:hypothetical protein F5141DRAFT_1289295 [Pisolithus sp. B1]|nr:hypothetical protein F5141DRAFT_1289295 [Pisolithus sp. B1]
MGEMCINPSYIQGKNESVNDRKHNERKTRITFSVTVLLNSIDNGDDAVKTEDMGVGCSKPVKAVKKRKGTHLAGIPEMFIFAMRRKSTPRLSVEVKVDGSSCMSRGKEGDGTLVVLSIKLPALAPKALRCEVQSVVGYNYMAPGRIKKWIKSLPLVSGSDSHRTDQSDDTSDLAPAATEGTATAGYITSDVASPVPAQIEAASQQTVSSGPAYHLDSKMAKGYMENIKRFRVLVMGRSNAGKTTTLQRVCNSTDKPEIFDENGKKVKGVVVEGTLAVRYPTDSWTFIDVESV